MKPNNIKITVFDNNMNLVDNIFLELNLYANRKNDYNMYTPLSKNGLITISRDWIENEMYNLASYAIMDYSSNFENCKNFFTLSLLPDDDVLRIREFMIKHIFIYTTNKNDIFNLTNSENYKYEAKKWVMSFDDEEMNIELKVKKREKSDIESILEKRVLLDEKHIKKIGESKKEPTLIDLLK